MSNLIIKHIKTGVQYKVVGEIKVKVNLDWVDMTLYENNDREQFARNKNNFDGFVNVESEFSQALDSHLESQGCLQINTSERLSLGAKSLLDEAVMLVSKGILKEVSGICSIRTFQEVNK